MYCKNCGNQLPDDATFCGNCGTPLSAQPQQPAAAPQPTYAQPTYAAPQPQYGYAQPQYGYAQPQAQSVGFIDAIKLYFQHYADFKGRSRRSEYWWVILFTALVSFIPYVSYIAMLAFFIPGLAICVRRLHDIGKSGWWYLLVLIPLVGSIILVVWFCQDSGPDNQWGPCPKGYRAY